MTILDELAAYAGIRVERAKENVPLEVVKEQALACADMQKNCQPGTAGSPDQAAMTAVTDRPEWFAFEKALAGPGIGFICEVKKASPSKGLIAAEFPYVEIAKEYEAAGAECISVLTEPKWFLGSGTYLKKITESVRTPCIRKDFTIDEYMIYEAKLLGAGAVLLICSLLDTKQLEAYIRIADRLGLSALVEAHDAEEIRSAVASGARMIGVNNRNLKDFTVDVRNSQNLRKLVPDNILFVAESGIRNADDVRAMREAGADAVLVGETLMRARDKTQMLHLLRGTN
ncbi:MAG TPA: indole-3-glycerol phosphate synthase TrpC [Lachnospiraceae bacterium]|nr:indole-3-glycerol phosphate synthase TrpC [Lachnospiraceae bacterium]